MLHHFTSRVIVASLTAQQYATIVLMPLLSLTQDSLAGTMILSTYLSFIALSPPHIVSPDTPKLSSDLLHNIGPTKTYATLVILSLSLIMAFYTALLVLAYPNHYMLN